MCVLCVVIVYNRISGTFEEHFSHIESIVQTDRTSHLLELRENSKASLVITISQVLQFYGHITSLGQNYWQIFLEPEIITSWFAGIKKSPEFIVRHRMF
jgi:hypothetical protein